MTRRFLNIHVLYSFAGANPNRDDTGTPKTLRYGGAERSRMSAQAMTRAKRVGYESDPRGERSYRSTQMPQEIAARVEAALEAAKHPVDDALRAKILKQAAIGVNRLVMKDDKADKKAEALAKSPKGAEPAGGSDDSEDPEAGDTLVWLAEAEIQKAVDQQVDKLLAGEAPDLSDEAFLNPGRTASLAIAAFGRMFAQRPDLQTEAAVQRSHAFTTHAAVTDLDYFTAVDDLRTSDRGAAHIGLRQETGGIYYWHANIDRDQLLATWDQTGVSDPRGNLTALAYHLVTHLPTGGQTHSAHQGLPALVLICEADAPVSLQTAFEQPTVPSGAGYLQPSIQALLGEHVRATRYAGDLFGSTLLSGIHAEPGLLDTAQTLDQAGTAEAVAAWVLNGELP